MVNETHRIDEHVGEWLSGFVDGELTQQQRQWVEVHCRDCAECRRDLDELRALRERLGKARLSEMGEDRWREEMNDSTVTTTRTLGWLLFVVGALAIGAWVVFAFLSDPGVGLGIKAMFVAFYGGLAVLLISVLRQRLIEHKTDKYKDVEI
jgi:anti-sigma factor RsiW